MSACALDVHPSDGCHMVGGAGYRAKGRSKEAQCCFFVKKDFILFPESEKKEREKSEKYGDVSSGWLICLLAAS